jgi:hypothetical protein
VADRDDDRFWKGGLIYVNRDDPAIMVGARFGVGWTLNFANPLAWLIIGGIVAAPTGFALILRPRPCKAAPHGFSECASLPNRVIHWSRTVR